MLKIKFAVVAVLMFVTAFAGATEVPAPTLKSYREWKTDKVQSVINRITATKALVTRAKTEANVKNVSVFERQLLQENWNLEVANDLSVTDYFVLYLTQQTQPDRFLKVAAKLTPAEVAELMEAYSKALANPGSDSNDASGVSLPAQATSLMGKGIQ